MSKARNHTLAPNAVVAADLFKNRADTAALNHAETSRWNCALANNQLGHALSRALTEAKGKYAYDLKGNGGLGEWRVTFPDRSFYVPEGVVKANLAKSSTYVAPTRVPYRRAA